jgi:ubiquitin-protein ligase
VIDISRLRVDPMRMLREEAALACAHGDRVRWCVFKNTPSTSWDHYGVIANVFGWRVVGRFEANHPWAPPRFTTTPQVRTHHLHHDVNGPYLCLWRPEEWNPNWTMATALGVVYRFLSLLRQGKVE